MIKKIKIKKIIHILLAFFLVLNVSWAILISYKYAPYKENFEKNNLGKYVYKDDSAVYSVKSPDYMQLIGNLSVSDEKNDLVLIIWPLWKGGYEYGVLINDENTQHQISLNENLDAIYEDQDYLVEKYKDDIQYIIKKADSMWNLSKN